MRWSRKLTDMLNKQQTEITIFDPNEHEAQPQIIDAPDLEVQYQKSSRTLAADTVVFPWTLGTLVR